MNLNPKGISTLLILSFLLIIFSETALALYNPDVDGKCGDGSCQRKIGEDCDTCQSDCGPCTQNAPDSAGKIRIKMDVKDSPKELWEFFLAGSANSETTCGFDLTEEDGFGNDEDCVNAYSSDAKILNPGFGRFSDTFGFCQCPGEKNDAPCDILYTSWQTVQSRCGGCGLASSNTYFKPKGGLLCKGGNWYLCDSGYHSGYDRPFTVGGNTYLCNTNNEWQTYTCPKGGEGVECPSCGGCESGLTCESTGHCCPTERPKWDPNANNGQGGCVPTTSCAAPGTSPSPGVPCCAGSSLCSSNICLASCCGDGVKNYGEVCEYKQTPDTQSRPCTTGTGTETQTCTNTCTWPSTWNTLGCTTITTNLPGSFTLSSSCSGGSSPRVSLSWTASAGADAYEVWYKINSDGGWIRKTTLSSSTRTYTDSPSSNANMYYQIETVNNNGRTESNTIYILTSSANCPGTGGGCTPESDSSFCARNNKNCGSYSNTDNCGNSRTVNCGSCASPQTCGGGGTANVCGGGNSCTIYVNNNPSIDACWSISDGYSKCGSDSHAVNAGTYYVNLGTVPSGYTYTSASTSSNYPNCLPGDSMSVTWNFACAAGKTMCSGTCTNNCGSSLCDSNPCDGCTSQCKCSLSVTNDPNNEACWTVSGESGTNCGSKTIDVQPGNPKYVYLASTPSGYTYIGAETSDNYPNCPLAGSMSVTWKFRSDSPNPVISVSKNSMSFTATTTGPNPPSDSFSITNIGGGSLSWSVLENAQWLSLSRSSGVEGAGATSTPPVTVSISKGGLGQGTYSTTISVSSNGGSRSVGVTLTISPPTSDCGNGDIDSGEQCGEPGLSCKAGQSCNNCKCTSGTSVCGNDKEEPGEECDRGTRNGPCPAECSNECKWNINCQPIQECQPNTWENSGSCGSCGTEQRWCDNNGRWTSQFQCISQGPCSPGQTQCSGSSYQSCNNGCQWESTGTDSDGDGIHRQCGDSQCDNAYGVSDATKQSTETNCADSLDNDCDGRRDCQDTDCAGRAGPGGAGCCQSASDCTQDDCAIESCVAGTCQSTARNPCDSTECAPGRYCYNGDCTDGDTSEYVCMNCAPDTTTGRWDWPAKIFEDAGKAYSKNTDVLSRLFDSTENACTGSSCTKPGGCGCYDILSTKTSIKRQRPLTTGNCCGDDPNEWYKKDYYGGECVSSANQCVWSDGNAQPGNSGNRQWWCNPGNWYECNDNTIGQGSPNNPPPQGVCCAGTAGSNGWTPESELLPESQYSCTDGKDNDCDGKIDCEDSDCGGTVSGSVKNMNNQPVQLADVSIKKDLETVKTITTSQNGSYSTSANCGTFNFVASHPDYAPETKSNIQISSFQNVEVNFNLVLGSSCEADCTYASDNLVHSSCDGRNGCSFYDSIARQICDLSQPGWARDYNETHYIICANGSPQQKVEVKSSLSCASGTIVKMTRIVTYNGKPVKLVVAACG